MQKTRVFADTNVILEAFRTGCWMAISSHFTIETVQKCVEETLTGNPGDPRHVSVPPVDLNAGLAGQHPVTRKDIASLVLAHPACSTLDDGEKHLFTWLFANKLLPSKIIVVTTADKAALVASHPAEPPAKPEQQASVEPQAPAPASAPKREVALPPAEITPKGNQAVVALLDSAKQYVARSDWDRAAAALERAVRLEPKNAGIWHDLAQIRLQQRQYRQAEDLAAKSNTLAGKDSQVKSRNWKVISVSRRARGDDTGAEAAAAQSTVEK